MNAFVDLYNAVSLAHVLPLGADDLDKVTPPLAFRYAREGDSFLDMAEEGEQPEAPKPGEVVYADAAHVLCRRWNWRQDARTLITPGDAARGGHRAGATAPAMWPRRPTILLI